jgi:hypothetical protein
MMDRAISSQPAMDFVRLLIDDVVPAMGLRGPITIMPEVKLSSFRYCRNYHLVVIDGEGHAHIFDYKTKRLGKKCFEVGKAFST